jgi:type II secretory pathway pseudopilin PulG
MIRPKSASSFTLVELLVVIGILAILTAAVVIVLNPAELLKQSRDSKRTTDLANLNNAIKLLLTQNPDVNLGSASTVYTSLADSSSTCGSYSLPSLPAGWKYQCATAANLNKVDGNGWIPVSFSAAGGVASLPALPVDPQNTIQNYYSYVSGGSWQIGAVFESDKYAAKEANDGGMNPASYEVGSNLSLAPFLGGMIGYWNFEEGSGAAAYDKSGNGNDMTWYGTGVHYAAGKIGKTAQLNGTDDYVMKNPVNNFPRTQITTAYWINTSDSNEGVISYASAGSSNDWLLFSSGGYEIDVRGTPIGTGVGAMNAGWAFIAATWDSNGGQLKVYKNGVQAFSGTLNSGVSLTQSGCLIFGQEQDNICGAFDPAQAASGMLDEVRIYSRVLSAAEIKALYDASK